MLYNLTGVFIDFKTTGLFPATSYPTQLAAIQFSISTNPEDTVLPRLELGKSFHTIIKPPTWGEEKDYSYALNLQGITRDYIDKNGALPSDAYYAFCQFLKECGCVEYDTITGSRLWAHNSEFDFGFLTKLYLLSKLDTPNPGKRNPINCSKKLYSSLSQFGITDPSIPDNLDKVCAHYGIPMSERGKGVHDPLEDVRAGIAVLQHIMNDMRVYHQRRYE